VFFETGAPAQARKWRMVVNGQHWFLDAVDDTELVQQAVGLQVDRAGNVFAGQDLYEKARGWPLGHWVDVPLSAGNFTAVPSGTVSVVTSLNQSYALVGRTVTYSFALNMTIGGTPTEIRIALPSGVVSAAHMAQPFLASGTTGMALVDAGAAYLSLYRDYVGTAWAAGNYWMNGVLTFRMN
jgi:hypothetical protein